MNIKIGDLLFEENNSNEIHDVFEKNILSEADDDSVNLNKKDLTIVAKKVCGLMGSAFPNTEKVFSGEMAMDQILGGLKKLEKRKISGGFEVNFFNLKGVKGNPDETPPISQADLKIYGELGFAIFEVSAKGQEIEGENAQGQNIVEYFAIPIPGFTSKEEDPDFKKQVLFHKMVFNLDLGDIGKDQEIIEIRHVGIGNEFKQVHVVEKGTAIEDLRTALRGKNYSKITTFLKKSNQGNAISVVSDQGSSGSDNDSGEVTPDSTQQTDSKEIAAGVRESYLHNHRLTDLLFEKKSLKKINTSQKKNLVENYFNVDYTSLNNYEKRDFLYFSNILLEVDRKNILLEAKPKALQKAQERGKQAQDAGLDYNGHPVASAVGEIPKTEKDKKSWLSKFAKVVPKLKDKAVTGLKDWIFKSGLDKDVVAAAEKTLGQSGFVKGQEEFLAKDDVKDISGEFSGTKAVVKAKEEDSEEGDVEGEDLKKDEDQDETQEDSLSSSNVPEDIKKKILEELTNKIEDKKLLSFYQNESSLNSFIDETLKKVADYKSVLSKVDVAKKLEELKARKDWEEATQEDRSKAEEIAKGIIDGNSEFNKQLDSYVSGLNKLKSTKAESDSSYINSLAEANFNAANNAVEFEEKNKSKIKEVYKYVAIISSREQKIKAACALQTATEICMTVHAELNKPPKELVSAVSNMEKLSKGDESGQSENAGAASRVDQALGGLEGISYEEISAMLMGDAKAESRRIKNKNLLLEDKKVQKNLVKIGDKIAVDSNGKINVSTIKSVYKSLDDNKNYKKIKDAFYKKFKSQLGKDISKATDDEIQEQLIDFLDSLNKGVGTPNTRGAAKTGTAGGVQGQSIIKRIFSNFGKKLLWGSIVLAAIGIVDHFYGWQVMSRILDAGKLWVQGSTAINVTGMTPAGPPPTLFGALVSQFPSLGNIGGLFTKVGTGIASIWTAFVGPSATTTVAISPAMPAVAVPGSWGALGAVGTFLASWAAAPFAATTWVGFMASALPWCTWLFVQIGALFLTAAGAATWLVGFFAGLSGFAQGAAWMAKGKGILISAKALFMAPPLAIGVGTVILLAVAWRWWSKRKNKNGEISDLKLGKVLKIYILAAATNKSYKDIVTILGMNPAEYMAELTKTILPDDDEMQIIIDALDTSELNKIPKNKETFKATIKAYKKAIKSLGKNKKIKGSTIGLLEELEDSLRKDLLLLSSGTISEEEFTEYYSNNSIKQMAMSYLSGNREHIAISDVNKNLLIDDKESLLASLQSSRNKTITSLNPLGNFDPSDDPIFYIASQIASAKKGKKLSIKYNIAKMIKKFPDKISDDQIDINKIISALSQSNANIAANDVKQFKSKGFLEKITLSSKQGQKEYAEKYLTYIHKNLLRGIEGCIDQSVFNESLKKKSNLLLEINNFNSKNYREFKKQLLTEKFFSTSWSWKGVTDGLGVGAGVGAVLGSGLHAAGVAKLAGTGVLAKLGLTSAALSIGVTTCLAILAGVMVVKIGGKLIDLFQDARFEGNLNPYSDKRYIEAITPHIKNIVKLQIGISYAKVLLQHKEALKKVGVEIEGEDHPMFADQMKEIKSQVQVAELKKNLSEEGESLYVSIRELGYYVRNANQDPGIGDFIPDNHLNKFIDDICLKSGAPLEPIFKALKDEKAKGEKDSIQAGVNEGFVYKEGLDFLLEQDDKKRSIKIPLNETFSNIKKVSKGFLYSNIDLNGLVNQEIIKIVEPHFNKGFWQKFNLSQKYKQKRGGGVEQFMYKKVTEAMSEVTGLDPKRCMSIIQNKKSRTSEKRKEDIGSNLELSHRDLLVHNAGLGVLLESSLLTESDKLNYVEKLSSGNYKYYYTSDIPGPNKFTELVVDPSTGKQVGGLVRSATDTSASLPASGNLGAKPAVQALTKKMNATYQKVNLKPSDPLEALGQQLGLVEPKTGIGLKSGIEGLDLKGTGVPAKQLTWLDYLPKVDATVMKYFGAVSGTYLALNVLDGFLAAPISERTLVPLISDIDWARLVSATYATQIVYLLESNKDKFSEMGIEITGSLPDQARKMMSGAKDAMGAGGEATGNLGVLSGAALNRLKKQKKGKEVTEADLAKVIEADIRKLIYAYHKSYRTETYENIQQAIGDNKTAKGYKKAKSKKTWKTNIGLAGLGLGAALLTGGASLVPSVVASLGMPAMLGGGLVYANRLSDFENDQMLSGDESAEAERSAMNSMLKDDIKALTTLIIDISKEAKGINESLKNVDSSLKLARLLFEAVSDSRVDVKKVISKLKSSAILVYDGSIKRGTEDYKSAESYTIDIVCSMLESICDIDVIGADRYRNPEVVVQNMAQSVVNADAPQGEPAISPAISPAAAIASGQPVPQMDKPVNPAQFMGMMNQMGGPMMMMMMPMMMMSMMPMMMMQGQQQQGFDFAKFFEQMSKGQMTTGQAVDQVSKAIDELPEDKRTVSSAAKSASGKPDKTVKTGDDFKDAFEKVLKDNIASLPKVNKGKVVTLLKAVQGLESILRTSNVNGILKLTPKAQKIFSGSEASRLKQFNNEFILGRLNVVEDDVDLKYKARGIHKINNELFPALASMVTVDNAKLKSSLAENTGPEIILAKQYIDFVLKDLYLKKVSNKVFDLGIMNKDIIDGFKTSLKRAHHWLSMDDKNKQFLVKFKSPFATSEIKVESRTSRKTIIKRKSNINVISEDYLMGDLSSLLFEESIVVENNTRKTNKKNEISNSNINLRKEWLKIWDI